MTNNSSFLQINFIEKNRKLYIFGYLAPDPVHPVLNFFFDHFILYGNHDTGPLGRFIVHFGDRPVFFLSGGVPQTEVEFTPIVGENVFSLVGLYALF